MGAFVEGHLLCLRSEPAMACTATSVFTVFLGPLSSWRITLTDMLGLMTWLAMLVTLGRQSTWD